MLGVVCGKRSAARILELIRKVKAQLRDRTPRLITTDDFASYATVLRLLFEPPPRPLPSGQGRGNKRPPRPKPNRNRNRNRKPKPKPKPKPKSKSKLNYATVCKRRENGRVVEVHTKVVCGSKRSLAQALKRSRVSRAVNTSFLERHNATDRHRNARKARRTYRFSKDWLVHQAVTCFSYYTYNFCWPVRTLRQRTARRRFRPRTPAMSARLTDHVWTLAEWLSNPTPGLST